jgi:hypothetical protein
MLCFILYSYVLILFGLFVSCHFEQRVGGYCILLREDIVCFLVSVSLYSILRVGPIMSRIYVYCVLWFILSQDVHYV